MKKEDKNVDISIIVPVYNTEKYLNKCIDSLINQTKKEIEIIIINDGSTDKSEEIIKSYKDDRIKYYKNKNQGIGKTRNFGINKATGKFLMFIDSDDYIREDCCKKMYENAIENKSSVVVSNFYKEINGELIKINIGNFETSTLKDNSDLIIKINPGPCNKIYDRKMIVDNKIYFDEDHKYEDSPFVIDSLIHAKKISKTNEYLSYYCIHNNSETTTRDDKVFDILYIIDKIRKNALQYDYLKESINFFTVDLITNYTAQQRAQKNKKVGNKFINEAFAYLEKEVPDYKNKKYYKNKSYLRRMIESHKFLTKSYCNITRLKYGRR